MWPEVEIARKENKRELNLQGVAIAERLNPSGSGLDAAIFALSSLNLLNISDTASLQLLPAELSNLTNLQTLLLYGNSLRELPATIGQLDKLKVLDVSRNQLAALPEQLAQLQHLFTVNLSQNKLTAIPALSRCTKLSVLDVSNNELTAFPDVCREQLGNLSEVHVKGNRIAEIPAEIGQLAALKVLGMEGNEVRAVPKALAAMPKLKEVYLKDNPIDKTDKRLHKLILQCTTKQILAHVAKHGTAAPKATATPAAAAAAAPTAAPTASNNDQGAAAAAVPPTAAAAAAAAAVPHLLRIQRHQDDTVRVIVNTDAVKDVRPHILCCVVRNLDLADGRLQRFLQLQSRLHESVCDQREKATIATHDYATILKRGSSITYNARSPRSLRIVPLNKTGAVSGEKLYNTLKAEAEQLRKEKKRNVYSGIHRYLYLVEKLSRFACLEDAAGEVISLPPLTNAEGTKIGAETRDVFVEVTSASSMPDCKAAMEELLVRMVEAGFGQVAAGGADEEVDDEGRPFESRLCVQQMKCTDVAGNLRRVFPAKTDFERLPATVVVRREA